MQIKIADISTQRIFLGWTGENQHVQFAYDFADVFAEYPDAGVGLTIQPPTGDAFPHTITRDGNMVIWEILASDCAVVGDGVYQFTFTQGETVAKSLKGFYTVKESLTGNGEAPTPIANWIADAEAALYALTGMTARAETLEPGEPATATIVEDNGRKVIVIGVPEGRQGAKGDKGDTGSIPNFTIGTVTTLPPEADATATITGTQAEPALNLGIPQGAKGQAGKDGVDGEDGKTPDFSIGTVETLPAGSSVTVTITGTAENPVLNFGIPQGAQGNPGTPGDPTELIDDNAGVGDSTKVWSANKSATERDSLKSAITNKQDKPQTPGTAGQVLGLDSNLAPVWVDQTGGGGTGDVSALAPVIKATASGEIASFADGAENRKIDSLVVNIEPVQDLHGQEYPYPAGGGKNLIPPGGATVTINQGVTISRDGDAFIIDGTATGSGGRGVFSTPTIPLVAGKTYTLSVTASVSCNVDAFIQKNSSAYKAANLRNATSKASTFTVAEGNEGDYYFTFGVISGEQYNNLRVLAQLEEGSTATAWSPYANVCPITGWTGAEVTRTGVNIASFSDLFPRYGTSTTGLNLTVDNGVITISGTSTGTGTKFFGSSPTYAQRTFEVKQGLTYTVSCKCSNLAKAFFQGNIVHEDETNEGWIYFTESLMANGRYYRTFTPQINGRVAFIPAAIITTLGESINETISDIQLESGSTVAAYHAYQGNTYNIEFPSSAGTVYGGSLTVNEDGTGKLIVDMASVNLWELGGSWVKYVSWQDLANNKAGIMCAGSSAFVQTKAIGKFSLGYVVANSAQHSNDTRILCYVNNFYVQITNGELAQIVQNTRDSALNNAIRTWLENNGAQFVGYLISPVEYTLTSIEVLETLKGVNNIWADTGDTTVTYRADTKLYVDNRITQAIAAALNA